MTRSVAYRLIALLILAILGVGYICFSALGLRAWNGPYTIKVILPSGGGIYTDAAVTYRGVQIGKVSAIHLHPGDVEVDAAIDHGKKIPSNVQASIKELTAAAEQYLELTPPGTAGPQTASVTYLKGGATIGRDANGKITSTVPTTIGTLLNTVNSLVNSVHANDLNTISIALANGLSGQAGTDLRSIINDADTLISALQQVSGPTISAITNGQVVLNTLVQTNQNFQTLADGLNRLSQSVANSDLGGVLQSGGAALSQLDDLLTKTNTGAIGLTNGLSETAGVANARQGSVQALFEVLPVVAQNAALTVDKSTGQARFQVTVNGANTVCPYTSSMAEPTSLVSTADLTRNCGVAAPDLLQRGSQKAPTPTRGSP